MAEGLRLQAYLSRAGVASRRASEDLIRAGRVRVNGRVAELGSRVERGDRVEVDGREVRAQRLEWVLLHKPRGYLTTREDPRGRRTVYDLLPADLHHLFHVGRLDRDSSGLLLMTNDGKAANRLLHRRFGTTREYLVDVEGEPEDEALSRLLEGVQLSDGEASAESVAVIGRSKAGLPRIRIVLREGRNREVRRMFEAIGHPVVRLQRRRFGPITLGRLPVGKWRALKPEEVERLSKRPSRGGI